MDSFLKEAEQFFVRVFRAIEEHQLTYLVKFFRSKSSELSAEVDSENFVNLMNNFMEDLFLCIHERPEGLRLEVEVNRELKNRQSRLLRKIKRAKKLKRRKRAKNQPRQATATPIVEEQQEPLGRCAGELSSSPNCIICSEEISDSSFVLLSANFENKSFASFALKKHVGYFPRGCCNLEKRSNFQTQSTSASTCCTWSAPPSWSTRTQRSSSP